MVEGRAIAPFPRLLIDRVTRMFHDSVHDYFMANKRIHDYTGLLGDVFKDYVGRLLRECFDESDVIDVDSITGLTGQRADWIVVHGADCAIFECKSADYPLELRRTGSLSAMDSFLVGNLSKALDQLDATQSQWQAVVNDYPKAAGVTSVCKFVVTGEHFHLANSLSSLMPRHQVVERIRSSRVQIISALDLETVVVSNYSADFRRVFIDKSNAGADAATLQDYVRQFPGFGFRESDSLTNRFRSFFRFSK